jgi:hypothetical protein
MVKNLDRKRRNFLTTRHLAFDQLPAPFDSYNICT